MVVTLRVLVGPELEEEIIVSPPRFTIGRAEDCNLRPNCPLVSRHHCELVIADSSVSIHDHNSKNGTFVNGQRVIGQQPLHSGDLLGVGLRRMSIVIEPAVDSSSRPSPVRLGETQEAAGEELADCLPWTPA